MENNELYKIIEFLGADAKLNGFELKFLDDICDKKTLTGKQAALLEKIKTKIERAEIEFCFGSVKRLVEAIQNSTERVEMTKFDHDFLKSIKHLKILSEKQAQILDGIKSKSWVSASQFKGGQFENIYTHEGLAMGKKIKAEAEATVHAMLNGIQHDDEFGIMQQ